jgi:hypothetical protein
MEFGQTAKTVLAAVFLAVVMFAVFVAGQRNPLLRGRNTLVASTTSSGYFPKGSEDGRFSSKCAASTLFGRTVCGVPFARLIATPERYHQSVIAVTGFLIATGQGRQSLYPTEDSYRNMGEYERVEIGTGVPDAIRAKLAQGVWVRVIGEFDGTYAGQPWGLGAISQVMDIAEARPDVSPVAIAAAPRVATRAQPPLQVPVPASSLLPQPASMPAPPPKAVLRPAEPVPVSTPQPQTASEPPKVALRTADTPVASAPPTPLSDNAAH